MNISVTTENIDWNIIRFGSGAEVLFAFHGFGEEAGSFLALEPSLGKYYTVYSVDLPFHGKTKVKRDHPVRKDFYEFMNLLIEQAGTENFSLAGYSMGGKICLDLVRQFAPRLNRLILIAPDGIKTSRLFSAAVYPSWGRWLFRKVMDDPKRFFRVLDLFKKMGMVSNFKVVFARNQLATPFLRVQLYKTWMFLKLFRFRPNEIAGLLNQYRIRVDLIYGQRDEVIQAGGAKKFKGKLHRSAIHITDRGHRLVTPFLNPLLNRILEER